MIKKLQIAFLVVVPLVFLVLGLRFDRTKYGTDPESAYLLNGINIACGKAVGHFDNPGTTVQMYSAAVISVTHLFRHPGTDLQTDVLSNSEFYIEVLRKGFILLNACILLLLGLFAFSVLKNFWAGLLLQVAPFLSVTLIEECFTKVAPEQMLFTAVAVLIILLLRFYVSDDRGNRKFSLLFGLLAGFGMATKLTFLPVLIIPFIVLKGQRNKWLYVGAIIPSFVLFTLPAVTGYLHMANWFLNLGTHTGTYGSGSTGFIDPAKYMSSLILIVKNNKVLVIVMILAALVLLFANFIGRKQRTAKSKKELSILISLLVAQFGSILMVAKHYQSNHYLFPALSLVGFVLIFIYLLISSRLQEKGRSVLSKSFPVLVAIVIGFAVLNKPDLTLAYEGYRSSNQSTNETFARLDREYKSYVKVYYYPVSFNEYASLKWGNVYSKQYSSEKLMELFPEGLFYNVAENSFQFWEINIPAKELIKKYGGRILLVGGPLNYEDFKKVEANGLKLKRLFDSRVQAVFEVDTANSDFFKGKMHSGTPKWSLQNDLETLSPDGQSVLSADGTVFCKNSAVASGKARSGKHAFSLPTIECYGMNYEIPGVKPSDWYEISIWKTANSPDAFLVASAGTADPFYLQSSEYTETDEKGWGKVMLNFKIPDDFKGNKLKIYLWNHGNSPCWFDDFRIDKY
ncbi:MAG: hypothetical protein WCI92_17110 [Bacteroidota bacterium]